MKMKKVMKKDIVAGLGEIGSPILEIILKKEIAIGYDLNEKLMNKNEFKKLENIPTSFLHVAIPVNTKFDSNLVKLTKKFQPECIVIHSTISPGTIERLQTKISVPIIYSATRGVHKRMLKDIRRYTKFFAISNTAPRKRWAIHSFFLSSLMFDYQLILNLVLHNDHQYSQDTFLVYYLRFYESHQQKSTFHRNLHHDFLQ